ncbi:MAG: ABC transporter substrate-binding protein [Methanothrix sp.]|nr:ABC transporter substrate-binding protein [Methanothrix sp.]
MEKLSIGYLSTLYHTSFILRGSCQLEEIGINASWKLFPNGPAMLEALESQKIDLGYIGLPPAMIGIARGLKIRCVAGGHVEGTVLIGGQSFQAEETASDALAQFKGKTVGTPRRGSIHDVILRKLIRDGGFGDSIEIKNFDWADFILDAMMDGEVDGACGTPPLAVLAARQGAKIILPPCKTWPFNPSYGIIATQRLIQESPSLLEDFLKLHEDACNLLREHPQKAARLVAGVIKIIDEDFAREVFRVSPKYCASLPGEYIDSALAFMPALQEMGYLARDLAKEEVFHTSAIEKVHPGRHHYNAQ